MGLARHSQLVSLHIMGLAKHSQLIRLLEAKTEYKLSIFERNRPVTLSQRCFAVMQRLLTKKTNTVAPNQCIVTGSQPQQRPAVLEAP